MADIHELKKFKKAKFVAADLENCIKIINLALAGLSQYSVYNPVKDSYGSLQRSKQTLQLYLNKCKKVIAEKGSIGGDDDKLA